MGHLAVVGMRQLMVARHSHTANHGGPGAGRVRAPAPRPPILWVKLTVPQITAHVGIIMEHKDIHLKLQFSSTSAFLLSSP